MQNNFLIDIIKHKFRNISDLLIKKDLLMDELLTLFVNFINKFQNENNIEIKWSLIGGTMLSKTFLEIHRLSEDIDISIFCKSKNQSRTIMSKILKSLENDIKNNKDFTIIDNLNNFKEKRKNYFNIKFLYKEVEFDFDLKTVLDLGIKIEERKICNIISKHNNELTKLSINTIEVEYVIAEKLLAFQRMYKNKEDSVRKTRHLYDIYSIFANNILKNDENTWNKISSYYKKIVDEIERESINNNLSDNIIFNKDIYKTNEIEKDLEKLISSECYKKENSNKIIKWFIKNDIYLK